MLINLSKNHFSTIKKVSLVLTALAVALRPSLSFADSTEKYASLSDIPVPLALSLNEAGNKEQFIYLSLRIIRDNAKDNRNLTKEDVQEILKKQQFENKHRQLQEFLIYDQNFDGEVQKGEVEQTFLTKGIDKDSLNKQVNMIMKIDSNKDNTITTKEMMLSFKTNQQNHPSYFHMRRISDFFDLDPNKDEILTTSELESLAKKAFQTLDKNEDSVLSDEEKSEIRGMWEQYTRYANVISPDCVFPKPSEGQKVVFVMIYEGKAVSNITLGSQAEEVNVVPVEIEKTDDKLYVVLASSDPVFWQIKGDSKSIENLVLVGGSASSDMNNDIVDEYVTSGATGVSRDKIVFRGSNECGFSYSQIASKSGKKLTMDILKKIIGKEPNFFFSDYSVSGIHIRKERVNTDISKNLEAVQKTAPKGFDPELWERHLLFMPGGLINLKLQDIVAQGPLEAYKVLPKWAGMAKLAYEGAIVPYEAKSTNVVVTNGNEPSVIMNNADRIVMDHGDGTFTQFGMGEAYKVVKDIPYYPSGLHGGFSTKFVIAKGVKPPKGDPGHSDVMSEETGKVIAGPGIVTLPPGYQSIK